MAKTKRFDKRQFVRELARERVGPVPSRKVIADKTKKKRAKYKEALEY